MSLAWGGNNGQKKRKTTQKYWKVRMIVPRYLRGLGDGLTEKAKMILWEIISSVGTIR